MATQIVDLTNYRDRTSARVPEGEYLVQIEDIEVGESRKGDPMWTVYLRIIGGEYDGQNLIDRLTLTERALFRVVGFLKGLGVKVQRKRMQVDTARFVGRKVRVAVGDGEPYNGVVRSEVRDYIRHVSKSAEEATDLDDVAEADESAAPQAEDAPAVEQTVDDADIDIDDIDI